LIATICRKIISSKSAPHEVAIYGQQGAGSRRPAGSGACSEARRTTARAGRQFKAAIASYHESKLLAGRKEFPATLDDLLLDSRGPGVNRHLRKVFVDPMTGKAEWGLVRVAGRIVGVHSLSDKRPIKQDGFDVDEAGFRHKRMVSEWVFSYTGRPQDAGKPTPPPGRSASGLASEPRT
jgi:hypothetical protein